MKIEDYTSAASRLKEASIQIRAHLAAAKRIKIARLDKIFNKPNKPKQK